MESPGDCRRDQPPSCLLTYTLIRLSFLNPLVQSFNCIKIPRQREFCPPGAGLASVDSPSQTENKEPREAAGLQGETRASGGAKRMPESLHQAQQIQAAFKCQPTAGRWGRGQGGA